MRIGIIFPVVIFITAVVFLAWFFIGGIKMKKTTIIMMGVAIIVVLGTELGWW